MYNLCWAFGSSFLNSILAHKHLAKQICHAYFFKKNNTKKKKLKLNSERLVFLSHILWACPPVVYTRRTPFAWYLCVTLCGSQLSLSGRQSWTNLLPPSVALSAALTMCRHASTCLCEGGKLNASVFISWFELLGLGNASDPVILLRPVFTRKNCIPPQAAAVAYCPSVTLPSWSRSHFAVASLLPWRGRMEPPLPGSYLDQEL